MFLGAAPPLDVAFCLKQLLGLASVTILKHESLIVSNDRYAYRFRLPSVVRTLRRCGLRLTASQERETYIYYCSVLAAMSGVALGTSMNKRAASYSRSAGVLPGRYDAVPDHSPTTRELSLEMIRTPPPPSSRPYTPAMEPYARFTNGQASLRPTGKPSSMSQISSFGGSLTKHSTPSFGFGVRPKGQAVKGLPGAWNGATVKSATGLTGYALKPYDVFGAPNATVRVHTPWMSGGVPELLDWSERPGFGRSPDYLSTIASQASLMAGNPPDFATDDDGDDDDEEGDDGGDDGRGDAAAREMGWAPEGSGSVGSPAWPPPRSPAGQRSLVSRGSNRSAGLASSRPSTANSTFLKPVMRLSFETIRLTEHPLLWQRALKRTTSSGGGGGSGGLVSSTHVGGHHQLAGSASSSALGLAAPLASSFAPYPCTYGLHPGFPRRMDSASHSKGGGGGTSSRRLLRPSSSPTRSLGSSRGSLPPSASVGSLGGSRASLGGASGGGAARASRVRESFPTTPNRPMWRGSAKPYPQERALGKRP